MLKVCAIWKILVTLVAVVIIAGANSISKNQKENTINEVDLFEKTLNIINPNKSQANLRNHNSIDNSQKMSKRHGHVRVIHLSPGHHRRRRRRRPKCSRRTRLRRPPFSSYHRRHDTEGTEEDVGVLPGHLMKPYEEYAAVEAKPYGYNGEYFPVRENQTEYPIFEEPSNRRQFDISPYRYKTIPGRYISRNMVLTPSSFQNWRPIPNYRPIPNVNQFRPIVGPPMTKPIYQNNAQSFKPIPEYKMHEPVPGQVMLPPKVPKFKPILVHKPLMIPLFRPNLSNNDLNNKNQTRGQLYYTNKPVNYMIKPVYEEINETDLLQTVFEPKKDGNMFSRPVSYQKFYNNFNHHDMFPPKSEFMTRSSVPISIKRNTFVPGKSERRISSIPWLEDQNIVPVNHKEVYAPVNSTVKVIKSKISSKYSDLVDFKVGGNKNFSSVVQIDGNSLSRFQNVSYRNGVKSEHYKVVNIFPNAPWVIVPSDLKKYDDSYNKT